MHHEAVVVAQEDLHVAVSNSGDIRAYLHRQALPEHGAALTPAWEAAHRLVAI
jgi:hypothetical protein